MPAIQNVDIIDTEYDRLFKTLAEKASDLDIPPDDAEELITAVLLSTLGKPHINDLDTWIMAAFLSVVNERGGQAS